MWSPVCLPVGAVGAIFVYIFTAELADLLISFAWFSLHWWLFLLMRFYWMFLISSFGPCEVRKTVKGTNIQTFLNILEYAGKLNSQKLHILEYTWNQILSHTGIWKIYWKAYWNILEFHKRICWPPWCMTSQKVRNISF